MALLLLRRIRPYGVGSGGSSGSSSSSSSSSSTRGYNCYRFLGGFWFFLLTLTATISIGFLSIRTYQQMQQVVHKTRNSAPQLQFNVRPTIPHSSLHTLVPSSSSSSSSTTTTTPPTFHVLFTLLGRPDDNNDNNNKRNQRKGSSAQPLYNSWQVSLKSVLLNAPTDRPLQIHVLCNSHAQRALHEIIHQQTRLSQSTWRNPITISTYNVEGFHAIWKTYLRQHLKSDQLDDRVSLGGYYRLLAHFILPLPKVLDDITINTSNSSTDQATTTATTTRSNLPPDSVLYMDSDVVILSNLNEIIPHLQDPKHGFVVVQFPPQWDRNLGHGWRPQPQLLLQEPDAAGMVHFQGGAGRPAHLTYFDSAANSYIHNNNDHNNNGVGGDVVTDFAQYCTRSKHCRTNAEENIPIVESTWGLARYYVQVPWHWVLYFGKSLIDPTTGEGYPLHYEAWTAIPPTVLNNNNNNTHNNENDPNNNSNSDDDITVMYPNGRLVPFTVRERRTMTV